MNPAQSAGGAPLATPAPPANLVLFDPGNGDVSACTPAAGITELVLARLRVYGIPTPAGSKVAFTDRTGKARLKEQNEAGHTHWRNAVAAAAAELAERIQGAPLDGAMALEATFRFPVPATRARKARARGGMLHKISAPDTSKLVRSLEDSLQAAGLIVNDARFATVFAGKFEVLDVWTGVELTIRRLP